MSSNPLSTISSVVVIVAAIALGVGAWFYHQQSVELEINNAELQQTKRALEQSTQKAQEQEKSLNDAVKNSQQYQEEQKVRVIRVSRLAKMLNAANEIKVAMAEHYQAELKWPISNKDVGVPPPDSYIEQSAASITVQPEGKIRMVLVNEAGTKEQVWLAGSVDAQYHFAWKCSSPDIVDIESLTPSCRYVGK